MICIEPKIHVFLMYYIFVYVLKYNLVNRIFSIIKRNFLNLSPGFMYTPLPCKNNLVSQNHLIMWPRNWTHLFCEDLCKLLIASQTISMVRQISYKFSFISYQRCSFIMQPLRYCIFAMIINKSNSNNICNITLISKIMILPTIDVDA